MSNIREDVSEHMFLPLEQLTYKEKSLFWLTVIKVPVHDGLNLVLWAHGEGMWYGGSSQ